MFEKLLRGLVTLGIVAAVTLLLFEAVLRLAPSVIPTAMLSDFHPRVRAEIAEGRGLRTREALAQTQLERADGGPGFGPFPPNREAGSEADAVDIEQGAVETVVTDGRGFCNPPDTPLGATLVVGDSFVWCQNLSLDQTWTRELSRRLDAPVYNAGIPGIGLYDYNDILRWLLREGSPRRVIMSIYGGNDLRDAIRFLGWHKKHDPAGSGAGEVGTAAEKASATDAGAKEMDAPRGACAGDPEIRLQDRSGFGKLYYHVIESSWLGCVSYAVNTLGAGALAVRKAIARRNAPTDDFRYTITHKGEAVPFNIHSGDTNEIWNGRALAEGRVELSLWQPALDAFLAMSRESGFQPLVVYIPSAFRAYPSVFASAEIEETVNGLHEAQAQFLLDWGAASGVPVLDLTAGLRAAAVENDALLYFPANVHLTAAGSAAVGRLVADWMREIGAAD